MQHNAIRIPDQPARRSSRCISLTKLAGRLQLAADGRADGAAVEDESLRAIRFSNAFSNALLSQKLPDDTMLYEKLWFKFGGSV